MLSGAQAMVQCLEKEGVSVVFGYPGAAICPFYDALLDSNVRHILVRQEQNAGHAASGYARASGKVGVCVVTSGPGATNLITAIASAYMDSIPMVAITGQVRSDLLGRDVFQEADITGAVEPFIKQTYLVKDTNEIPRVFREAFHIASTGRPGPVLIDIPVDIQTNLLSGEFVYPEKVDIIGYKPKTMGNPLQIKRAVDLLREAKRPVMVAGGGVLMCHAEKALRAFAEKLNIPVVSTMMGIGVMPSRHRLYYGMLGTHGMKPANRAIHQADVLVIIGARVGDRAVAAPGQVSERSKIIHIDIDPAEIGKNLKTTVPLVCDAKNAIAAMSEQADFQCPQGWVDAVDNWRSQYYEKLEEQESPAGFVDPRRFMQELSAMAAENAILVADVGQNQIWSANHYEIKKGKFLTSGGMGTMGYSLPAAEGAKVACPSKQVFAVCGDGSFQMQMMELATMVQHQISVKIVIMRNGRLGMVRELQDKQYDGRLSGIMLDGSPDFITLASAYGIRGRSISENGDIRQAIADMLVCNGPYVLECAVSPVQPSL